VTINIAYGQTLKLIAKLSVFYHDHRYVESTRTTFFDNIVFVTIEGHRKRTENDNFISQILYIEKWFKRATK